MEQFLLKCTSSLTPFLIYDNRNNLCYTFKYKQRFEKKIFPVGDLELVDSNGNEVLMLKQKKILAYPFSYVIEKNGNNLGKVYSEKSSRLNPEFVLIFNKEEYRLKIHRQFIFFLPKFNVTKGTELIAEIHVPTISFINPKFKIDVKTKEGQIPIFLLSVLLRLYQLATTIGD